MDSLSKLLEGFSNFTWQSGVMLLIGGLLIALAIWKKWEPMLLLPIGFGAIMANIPLSSAVGVSATGEPGFLSVLYDAGIVTELFPILIFVAIGAMIDFTPLFKQPFMLFFGGAAQFGIFMTMMLALCVNLIRPGTFSIQEAGAIGIIGAADGPTSIFAAQLMATKLIAPITVAAYSYMSLVPMIQPPVIRALTTKKERMIRMEYTEGRPVPKIVKILFPILVTVIAGFIAPISVSLIGALMFGNLLRECTVLDKLSETAQNALGNLVTLLLGITIGSTMKAAEFLTWQTLLIMSLGLIAFVFDTAGGVLFAKFLNLFLKKKINPMIGACGISAFPMSARVIHKMGQQEDPGNFLLMPAISANVSGQIGSIIAGSVILAMLAS